MGCQLTAAEIQALVAKGAVLGPTAAEALLRSVPFDDKATERQFQAAVIATAKRAGWRCYHTYDSRKSEAGFPDLVMVRGPLCVFAELKAKDGKATAAQMNWLDDLRQVTAVKVELWRPENWNDVVRMLT